MKEPSDHESGAVTVAARGLLYRFPEVLQKLAAKALGTAVFAALAIVAGVGCASSNDQGTTSSKGSVTVPLRAQQTDIVEAYDMLHRLGLRVATTHATPVSYLIGAMVTLSPRPGTPLTRGSIVKITPQPGPIGSPSVLNSNPRYIVPSFIGQDASAAIDWAEQHNMFWSIPRLPALRASDSPHLFDAYKVIAQNPSAGGVIEQGHMVPSGGYMPTPLTLTVIPK